MKTVNPLVKFLFLKMVKYGSFFHILSLQYPIFSCFHVNLLMIHYLLFELFKLFVGIFNMPNTKLVSFWIVIPLFWRMYNIKVNFFSEKIVLAYREPEHFDVLPEGWVEVTHTSGLPIYLVNSLFLSTFFSFFFIFYLFISLYTLKFLTLNRRKSLES